MNRERWKAVLPYIQAFVEGKDIELESNTGFGWWRDSDPTFSLAPERYRIKSEPRTIYVDTDSNRIVGPYIANNLKVVKFIEVIE